MNETTHPTGRAYDEVADLYTDLFSNEINESALDRALLGLFADGVDSLPGSVLDAGCGPGHVTEYLAGLGLDATGVDTSSAFIDIARAAYPSLQFAVGDMTSLDATDRSVAGIVCRYSTIHVPPSNLDVVFEEFVRVLGPGGQLLISFFGTSDPDEHGNAFDHQVATAYQCDLDAISAMLATAGLTEISRHLRQPRPDERRQFPQSVLIAGRPASSEQRA